MQGPQADMEIPMLTLTVENHRAFRAPATLSLPGLTLLYGQNQAGKSSLARLLPLLSDSHERDQGPLALGSASTRGATFSELCWRGAELPAHSFTVRVSDRKRWAEWTWAREERLVVRRFRCELGAHRADISYAGVIEGVPQHAGELAGVAWQGPVDFNTLSPSGAYPALRSIARATDLLLRPISRVQWLSARREPQSPAPPRARAIGRCSPNGEDVAHLLIDRPQLLDAVARWFEVHLGERLELFMNERRELELAFRRPGVERLPLRLAGEGVAELLPIVVVAFWAQTGEAAAPTTLVVEEPESNLHPNLTVPLFQLLLHTAKLGVLVVVETHAVHLLRAAQLAVLRQECPPSLIELDWVVREPGAAGSSVRRATVRSDGSLSGWPPDAFGEEYGMAREILDLQITHGADVDVPSPR
jgi:predicted ATPase